MNKQLIIFLFFTKILFAQSPTEWWRTTTVYQIYPRSFYDTDSNGIGDLNGIILKLDYIQSLGFQTIWISPFFVSPQKDFGYDISDYYGIAPEYGNLQLCEQLIREVHKRNMKIVFDLVMNHTSDEHEWFKTSASSLNNDYADWYIWKYGKGKSGKKPPTNWKSMIGGSGWHYNSTRKQFYWSSFLPFQPDLNYYNHQVKQEMLNIARYWLGMGIDGFRLDIFNAIYEDTLMKNNPFSFRIIPSEENPNGFFQKMKYNVNQEKSFEFATELRSTIDSFPGKYLIGEVFGNYNTLKNFCSYRGKSGLNSVFLFKTLSTPFKANAFRKMVEDFEEHFSEPFIPTYVFSNHDRKRSFSRYGESVMKAKLLALFQFTVRGIPFTYYGEELGVSQQKIPFKAAKDAIAHRFSPFAQKLAKLAGETLNRDECRTPMLWNDSINAGFTTVNSKSWLPVSDDYKNINVNKQLQNENSLLNFYKEIISIRNNEVALQKGIIEISDEFCSKKIFAYYRVHDDIKYLILLNMSKRKIRLKNSKGLLKLSTYKSPSSDFLLPFEGQLLMLKN
jgi:glycosidase